MFKQEIGITMHIPTYTHNIKRDRERRRNTLLRKQNQARSLKSTFSF